MNKQIKEQFEKDMRITMDTSYEELRLLLIPVMNNKTKFVNGKLMKDCFKYISNIVQSHQQLQKLLNQQTKEVKE